MISKLSVCTWYVHHDSIRRWTAPRILQLVGPAQTWDIQLSTVWIDIIIAHEWYNVTIIQPDPARLARHRFVTFDLVISQPTDSPRIPGIIAVISSQVPPAFELYSMAVSLRDHVSGYMLVQAVCLITRRWQQIPTTMREDCPIGHGDSFIITVQDRPLLLPGDRSATHQPEPSDDSADDGPSLPGRSSPRNQWPCPPRLRS